MAQSLLNSSGNRVLAEISQTPVAQKNRYDALNKQLGVLERHADFLATRLEEDRKKGNQVAYNAILKQLQTAESRINGIVIEMNSIAEASRYRAVQDRKQQVIADRKQPTVMDRVRESLPVQLASGVVGMINDTGKGLAETTLMAEEALRNTRLVKDDKGRTRIQMGRAGTQLNPETMQMEDIYMGDVADTYAKELAGNAGMYIDALNSLGHWQRASKGMPFIFGIGSKPDSQDEMFANAFRNAMPRIFGTKDIIDPTISEGAKVVADPLSVVPLAGGAVKGGKAVAKAVDEFGDIAKGFRKADGRYVPMSQAGIFVPLTPYTNEMGRLRAPKPELHQSRDYEQFMDDKFIETYSPTIQGAYKKYKELKAQGVSPKEIFRQTRIFENVDGIPYFETDDSLAKIDLLGIKEALRNNENISLNDVFSHPELVDKNLRQYGQDSSLYSLIKPTNHGGAFYDPVTGNISINRFANTDDIESSLLHELTHKEAYDQGLSLAGTSVSHASRFPQQIIDDVAKKRQEIVMDELDSADYEISKARNARNKAQANPNISDKELIEYDNKVKEAIKRKNDLASESMLLSSRSAEDLPWLRAYDAYLANNNEALARLAQERMRLSGQERADQYILDDGYMRQTVGVNPNDTWFARYQGLEAIPTYPKYMIDSAVDYLYGNRPASGKYVMPDILVDENYRSKLLSGS